MTEESPTVTSPSQDPPHSAEEPRWRDRVRASLVARMPPGGRRRAVALAARESGRDVREAAASLRRHWTAPDVAELPAPPYPIWLVGHRRSRAELAAQRARADEIADGHDVLVVVLPGDDDPATTVTDLLAQSSPRWRALLCTGDPGPTDERITVVPAGGDPAAAANAWLARHDRELTILLRAGDRLASDCVFEAALEAHRAPTADLITWDDDVAVGRQHRDPRFRPSWSPELLLAEDYPGRAFALRASVITAVGGLGPALDPAVHWDLLLRADLPSERVRRVARVLSSVPSRSVVSEESAVATVQAHLDRRGLPGRAAPGRHGGVRVVWELVAWPTVTVVVPTRHNRPFLSSCLTSVAASDYPSFDVVVVDNGERIPENEQWYSGLDLGVDLDVVWWDRPFNYSAVNNAAAARSDAQVLVFLNDDTEVLDRDWLRELVGWSMQPDVGVAGLNLVDPAGAIQHAGVVLGMSGFADHVFAGMPPGSGSMYGPSDRTRNVLAVTGACCAVRREVFDELGGFDERFQLTGSDVALGLSAVLSGRRNVCSPHASVRHLESATRGTDVPPRGLLHQLLEVQPLALRGRSVLEPESVAAQSPAAPPGCERGLRARSGGADPRPGPAGLPATQRRRRVTSARRHVPDPRRGRPRDRGGARGEPGGRSGPDPQLVPARHRQPLLRGDQHRPAVGRPPDP